MFVIICYYFLSFQKERCQQAQACPLCNSLLPTGQMEITADCWRDFPGEQQGRIPGQHPSASPSTPRLSQRRRPAQGPQLRPRRTQIVRVGLPPASHEASLAGLHAREERERAFVPRFLSDFPVKCTQARTHLGTRPLGAIAGCLLKEDERAKGRSYS